jgi:ribosome biogenesis protein Nip4
MKYFDEMNSEVKARLYNYMVKNSIDAICNYIVVHMCIINNVYYKDKSEMSFFYKTLRDNIENIISNTEELLKTN